MRIQTAPSRSGVSVWYIYRSLIYRICLVSERIRLLFFYSGRCSNRKHKVSYKLQVKSSLLEGRQGESCEDVLTFFQINAVQVFRLSVLMCQQSEPAVPLVQRALPAQRSWSGEDVRLPVRVAAETGPAQTHCSDGHLLPLQQAGLELVRKVKGRRLAEGFGRCHG